MNYKNIMLGILLIPSATFAQTSLEKLKQQRYEKLLEIRKIAQEITEAYRGIMNMTEPYRRSLNISINDRLTETEAPMSKEEIREIISNENEKVYEHVQNALEGQHQLDNTVLDSLYSDDYPNSFCAHTFLELNSLIEFLLIKSSVEKYKKALAELVIITHQISAEENHA